MEVFLVLAPLSFLSFLCRTLLAQYLSSPALFFCLGLLLLRAEVVDDRVDVFIVNVGGD